MKFENVKEIYYGCSDGGFEEFIKQHPGKCEDFVAVIGGMYFLNFLPYLGPKKIVLVDINPWAIELSKIVIDAILKAKDKTQLFGLFKKGGKGTIRENLQIVGEAYFNNDWDESSKQVSGRTREHPSVSWAYALDNMTELKRVLSTADITYKVLSISDPEFSGLINDDTWVWLSNAPGCLEINKGVRLIAHLVHKPGSGTNETFYNPRYISILK
jgi:hypothetical protein